MYYNTVKGGVALTKTDKEKIRQLEADIKKMQNDNKSLIDDFDNIYYGEEKKKSPMNIIIPALVAVLSVTAIILIIIIT